MVSGRRLKRRLARSENVTVSTEVTVDGRPPEYERMMESDEDRRFAVTVPYAGKYLSGDETVRVTETDVVNGGTVFLGS